MSKSFSYLIRRDKVYKVTFPHNNDPPHNYFHFLIPFSFNSNNGESDHLGIHGFK